MAVMARAWLTSSRCSSRRTPKAARSTCTRKSTRGGELTISVPANYFPTAEHAVKHLLIAGGIGITPLLAHRSHLKLHEQRVELHYTFRSAETAAFVPFLGFQNDPNVHLYDDSLGQKLDIPALIRRQPEGTHLYTCGPRGTDGRGDQRGGGARLAGRVDSRRALRRRDPGRAMSRSRRSANVRARRSRSEQPSTCWIVSSTPASRSRSGVAPAVAGPAKLGSWRGRSSIAIRSFPPPSGRKGKKMLACVSRGQGSLTLNL